MKFSVKWVSMIIALPVYLAACGSKEEAIPSCGCGNAIDTTFINTKATVYYDNPGENPEPGAGLLVLQINQWDVWNQDSVIHEYFPCDFALEDRLRIARDSLELRITGTTHYVCDQAKYVGRPIKIQEYTVIGAQ